MSFILPNTDGLFKAWWKILKVLLYIYPAVAFIIGVSTVAASLVMSAAMGNPKDTSDDNAIMMMIAVAMPAMGIAAGIMLARTMGSIMGKLGIKNPFGGAVNAARDWAAKTGKAQDDRFGGFAARHRMGALSKSARERKNQMIYDQAAAHANRSSREAHAKSLRQGGFSSWRAGLGGGKQGSALAQARASQELDALDAEDVKASRVLYANEGYNSQKAMDKLAQDGDRLSSTERRALRQIVAEEGNADHIRMLWDDSRNWKIGEGENAKPNSAELRAFAEDLKKNKPVGVGMGAISKMQSGKADSFDDVMADGIVAGRFSAANSAGAENEELGQVLDIVRNKPETLNKAIERANTATNPDGTTRQLRPGESGYKSADDVLGRLNQNVNEAISNPRFNVSKNYGVLEDIANATASRGGASSGGGATSPTSGGGSTGGGTGPRGGTSGDGSGSGGGSTPAPTNPPPDSKVNPPPRFDDQGVLDIRGGSTGPTSPPSPEPPAQSPPDSNEPGSDGS